MTPTSHRLVGIINRCYDGIYSERCVTDEPQFDWDDANESHIWQRHGVDPREAEESLTDLDLVVQRAPGEYGEPRWRAIGSTETGRILFVVFTRRGRRMRVVTAREASEAERRLYRRMRI